MSAHACMSYRVKAGRSGRQEGRSVGRRQRSMHAVCIMMHTCMSASASMTSVCDTSICDTHTSVRGCTCLCRRVWVAPRLSPSHPTLRLSVSVYVRCVSGWLLVHPSACPSICTLSVTLCLCKCTLWVGGRGMGVGGWGRVLSSGKGSRARGTLHVRTRTKSSVAG